MSKSKRAAPLAPAISYLRVSTQRQGASGLGLEAQREAVRRHLAGRPLVREFVEVESGRKNHRPQLLAALALCRETGGQLIIAKLDRLARSVFVISSLMESKVDFLACDLPEATPLVIHVMAAMAEFEAKAISERTRNALAAAKARGTRLGFRSAKRRRNGPSPKQTSRMSAAVRSKQADERALALLPTIEHARSLGVSSYSGLARTLNEFGVKPLRGRAWFAATVRLLLLRLAKLEAQRKIAA